MPDIISEIDKVLSNEIVERHTFYQLKFFILGAEPTNQAKLQCCLRELRSRRLSLVNIHREVQELKDQKSLLNLELDRVSKETPADPEGFELTDPADVERFEKEREIEIRSLKRKIGSIDGQVSELDRKLRYLIEECQFFVSAFNNLTEEEPLKPWDSLEVQKEYWDAKLGKEFKTRLILGQPLDSELVKAIESLHDGATTKRAVLQLMRKQEEFNRANGLPMPEGTFAALPDKEEAAPKDGFTGLDVLRLQEAERVKA